MERTEMDWHKYAVSLEVQLTNAAMQNGQLEQQLAQARAKIDHLQDELLVSLREREKLGGQVGVVACLQEELAQAREEANRWKTARDIAFQMSIQRQNRLEAENEQAQALLEEVAGKNQPAHYAGYDEMVCGFCWGLARAEGDEVEHKPDCQWVKIRAFLARKEGE